MYRAADAELDPFGSELVDDVTRIAQRARQTVELRDNESVAGSTRRQRDTESRPLAVRSGQPVIDVDVIAVDAKLAEREPLCRQILFRCRNARVSDKEFIHARNLVRERTAHKAGAR